MFVKRILLISSILVFSGQVFSQASRPNDTQGTKGENLLIITGARFSYRLVEKWIDEYTRIYPDVQLIIESRGSSDPLAYDILVDAYEHPPKVKATRDYLYIARYAVLPVANSASAFASEYSDKGLSRDVFIRIFFHDIFSTKGQQKTISSPFTVYTRMQKAGAPSVFAQFFGYEQKDIKGTAVAGADTHLLKALLRDSTGVGYAPLSLIYDEATRKPIQGLTVLPPDLNGNKRVTSEEKFYDNLNVVLERLEGLKGKDINNIPIAYLHLSLDRENAKPEAIRFVTWVKENGLSYLHQYGYLMPEDKHRLHDAFSKSDHRSNN